MKRNVILGAFAAAAFLTAFVSPLSAGMLTIEHGPSFLPNSSFVQNSIEADLFHQPLGDVVRLFGVSNINPDAQSPRILIGGQFNANPGDVFSINYNFNLNLGTTEPITLTLGAQTITGSSHEIFQTTLTLNPGQGHYEGSIMGPTFDLATSGTWNGRLFFNFSSSTEDGGSTDNPDPGGLLIRIRAIDFQLTAIPEPSSFVYAGIGLALLACVARRRRLTA